REKPAQLTQAHARSTATSTSKVEVHPRQLGGHVGIRTTRQSDRHCTCHQCRVTRHTLAPCLYAN
ncbi:hypothetical protein GW17_00060961, partial [Ensete ventricosum]